MAETENPNRSGLIVVVSRSQPFLTHSAELLRLQGVSAAHIAGPRSSSKSYEDQANILAAVRSGELRVLYLRPQFLQDYTIVAAMREAQWGLHLLVIDETQILEAVSVIFAQLTSKAHCLLTQQYGTPG